MSSAENFIKSARRKNIISETPVVILNLVFQYKKKKKKKNSENMEIAISLQTI